MTAPSLARRSFVRTNAPPLPGLTCWNSRILKMVPSTSMWLPFLNWLVEIERISPFCRSFRRGGQIGATRRVAVGLAAREALGGRRPVRRGRRAFVAASGGRGGRRHDVRLRALDDRHDLAALALRHGELGECLVEIVHERVP